MRRNLCLMLIGNLLLAACGGNAAPTATAILPTVDTSASSVGTPVQGTPVGLVPTEDFAATQAALPTSVPQQRAYETDEASSALPIPGTMVAPTTPDPDAGLLFDTIQFERTGGIAGQTLTLEIKSDGTVTRDGVASTIAPDQVTLIDTLIDQLNFFGLQGVFESPGTSADTYHYVLTIERAGASRMIKAEDGFTPPELLQFFSLLGSIAAPA